MNIFKKIFGSSDTKKEISITELSNLSSRNRNSQFQYQEAPHNPGSFVVGAGNQNSNLRDYWQPDYSWLEAQVTDILYACLHLRAMNASKAQPRVYKTIQQTEWELVDNMHPFVQLLNKPQQNSNVSMKDLLYKSTFNKDVKGNSYWYFAPSNKKGYSGKYLPAEIYVLDIYQNTSMIPNFDYATKKIISWTYKPFGNTSSETYIYQADEILHFKTFSPTNHFFGQSLVSASKSLLNIRNAILWYEQAFFDSGGSTKPFISPKEGQEIDSTEFANWVEKVNNTLSWDKAYNFIGCNLPLEINKSTFAPAQTELLDIQKFNLNEILAMTGVPPTMVSFTEGTFVGVDNNSLRSFRSMILDSILNEIDQGLTNYVQSVYDPNLVVELELKLPIDEKAVLEKIRVLGSLGALTINQALLMLEEETLKLPNGQPDPKGDELIGQQSVLPAKEEGSTGINTESMKMMKKMIKQLKMIKQQN